jgi:hypothetical protein
VGSENRAFATYVMADVYALLDFLSGRDKPSLGPLPQRRVLSATRLASPSGDVQMDLEPGAPSSSEFVQEAMRIARLIDESDANIPDDDVAFLIQARDLLNVRAAPATGNSIIFTLLVIDAIHSLKRGLNQRNPAGPIYVYRDAWLEPAAMALARDVRKWLCGMGFLLIVTILVSVYVAYGKLLSDTIDAVNRDRGANLTFLAAEMAGHNPAPRPGHDMIDDFCAEQQLGFGVYQHCQQYNELKQRKASARTLIVNWTNWPLYAAERQPGGSAVVENDMIEQLAAARIGVIGNYILPVMYGTIGSLGFILRQFKSRLAGRLLTSRESRASRIRLMLGAVSGACIGLFFNNSAGAAQVTGIGGAAVTLSASAIAFLAGYGVEAVFKTLDALLNHVFVLNQQDKPHPLPPATSLVDIRR